MYSALEFNTAKKALYQGYRSDNRKFEEPRDLKITCSQSPGFVLVQLGKTMITARTTAFLDVPSPSSPNRGKHLIKVYGPPFIKRSEIDTFQTTLRMIWRAISALEEDTLCVKIGEKVWKLTTQVVINDRDGGLMDASIIAIYASLSQICFPSFDTSTGNLYPPSQRRTHKVAFSIKPICVTVSFINEKQNEAANQNANDNKMEDDDFYEEEEEEEAKEDKIVEEEEKAEVQKEVAEEAKDEQKVEEEEEDKSDQKVEEEEKDEQNEEDKEASENSKNKEKLIKAKFAAMPTQSLSLRKRRARRRRAFVQPKRYIIVDPTAIEADASSGYATFIITEHQEQVYLISKYPGNLNVIDEAREAAIAATLKWRKVIEEAIEEYNKRFNLEGLPCVGEPADFIDYKPPSSNLGDLKKLHESSKNSLSKINDFELWRGNTKEKFVLDFFRFFENNKEDNATTGPDDDDAEEGDWLHSSLIK